MKYFSQLVLTVIGGLLIALGTPYLIRVANPDRLVAEIRPGAWYPYPIGKGPYAAEFKKRFTSPNYAERLLSGEDLRFARIEIRNLGRKTVDNIRIKFGDGFSATAIILDAAGERSVELDRELRLSSMAPGDHQTIYLWSSYDIESQFDYSDIESISSEGKIGFKYYKLKNDTFRVGDGFPWIWLISFISGCCIAVYVLACIIMANVFGKYTKQILEDEDFYINERVRYVADPKRFLIKPLT